MPLAPSCTRPCLPSERRVLLLFIGIHNAWDAVTYHVFVKTGDNELHR
jgi:hypothetical protein